MAKSDCKTVDEYIASHPEAARGTLERVRNAIRKAVPRAEETISYKMPTYKLPAGPVLFFAGWKRHYSLYPASGCLVAAFQKELTPYEVEKGTIRFPLSQPVPVKLIGRIARFRAKEVAGRERSRRAREGESPRRRVMEKGQRNTGLPARIRRRLGNVIRPGVKVNPVPEGIQADWNVPVTVRDGTTLRVNLFRPVSQQPVPVIMSAHPYGKDKIPARTRSGRGVSVQYRAMPQPRVVEFSAWTSWEAPDPAVWAPRGYAVVNADLRGGGTSDGIGDLLSDEEALDYYDLIEWAGTQPWSSGRVGLDGVSYLAISQYKVAALRPPHLAAICPWEGFSDLYRDFVRPGGAREDGFSVLWSRMTAKVGRVRTNLRPEVIARTERDEWYESLTPALEKIEVPMLVCGSFSDHCLHTRGSFEAFRRVGSRFKRLYTHRGGKWSAYYSQEATQARIRFFDYTLKGIENGLPLEAPVRLAIHDEGPDPVAVVSCDSWPPADLAWVSLRLDAGGKLHREPVSVGTGSSSFSTEGAPAKFDWVVEEDLDAIGPMALRVYIEIAGATDAVLFAGIRKFRAGREVMFEGSFGFAYDMVTKGWQRVAHRELDERLSTPEQPVHTHARSEPLRPGEAVAVDIALLPQATRFLKGDLLRLELRGSWHYPRDPFRGQYPAAYQPSPRANVTVHCGGGYESRLLLGLRPAGG